MEPHCQLILPQDETPHKIPHAYLELLQAFEVEQALIADEHNNSGTLFIDTSGFKTSEEEQSEADIKHQHIYPEYEDYYVYDDLEHTYKLENNYWERTQAKRKPHLYCRKIRFRSYLFHILGVLGTSPDIPISKLCSSKKLRNRIMKDPENSYEIIYRYLRKRKARRTYISIPWIISCLGGPRWNEIPYDVCTTILGKFNILHNNFNTYKKIIFNRLRFPKLHYIVLKMLMDEGIKFPYTIPLTRTRKRQPVLDSMYNWIKHDLEIPNTEICDNDVDEKV
jgi:hypothetical protein